MSEIDPLIVQHVLLHRAPAKVNNITAACRVLAEEYGVTQETLRTYAHKGVPSRSKIGQQILHDYAKAEADNFSAISKVSAARENLINSIEEIVKAYRDSANMLESLRSSLIAGKDL